MIPRFDYFDHDTVLRCGTHTRTVLTKTPLATDFFDEIAKPRLPQYYLPRASYRLRDGPMVAVQE